MYFLISYTPTIARTYAPMYFQLLFENVQKQMWLFFQAYGDVDKSKRIAIIPPRQTYPPRRDSVFVPGGDGTVPYYFLERFLPPEFQQVVRGKHGRPYAVVLNAPLNTG